MLPVAFRRPVQVDPYDLPGLNARADEPLFKIQDSVEIVTILMVDEDTGEEVETEGKLMVFSEG